MRFIPPMQSNQSRSWGAGVNRPAFDLLPPDLVELLIEFDRVGNQAQEERVRLQHMADPARDAEAKAVDDEKSVTAARAGKALPEAKAVPALEKARQVAKRNVEIQEAAHIACSQGLDGWLSDNYDTIAEAVAGDLKERRVTVEALADELSTAVEDAVRAGAVRDWMSGGVYFAQATTWPADAIPSLGNCGIDRTDAPPVPVRSIIVTAATTVLEDPNV